MRLTRVRILQVWLVTIIVFVIYMTYSGFSYKEAKVRSGRTETILVIVTYMRSGSSFTGDLFQRSPDVFYIFEPLSTIHNLRAANKRPLYFTKRAGKRSHYYKDTLEAAVTCNFLDMDIRTLNQRHMNQSIDTAKYKECVSKSDGIKPLLDCLPLLETPCRDARVVCVKTIKASMGDMYYLLQNYPEVKVLHLLRDPRPTLVSRRRMIHFNWTDLTDVAKAFCSRVGKDLIEGMKIKLRYPGRIATVRYEDIVDHTDEVLKKLYDYVGLDLTPEVRDYVQKITKGVDSKDSCGNLCTWRNSTHAKIHWRRELKYQYVKQIDSVCSYVYKKMRYLSVEDDKSLTDLSIPVYSDLPIDI